MNRCRCQRWIELYFILALPENHSLRFVVLFSHWLSISFSLRSSIVSFFYYYSFNAMNRIILKTASLNAFFLCYFTEDQWHCIKKANMNNGIGWNATNAIKPNNDKPTDILKFHKYHKQLYIVGMCICWKWNKSQEAKCINRSEDKGSTNRYKNETIISIQGSIHFQIAFEYFHFIC